MEKMEAQHVVVEDYASYQTRQSNEVRFILKWFIPTFLVVVGLVFRGPVGSVMLVLGVLMHLFMRLLIRVFG